MQARGSSHQEVGFELPRIKLDQRALEEERISKKRGADKILY